MKTKKYTVKVEGTSPYLMHKFGGAKDESTITKPRPGEPNWKAEAEDAIYRDEKQKIYIPSSQIHGCLINAGKTMKIKGKGKATYSKIFGAFILVEPACLTVSPQEYVIDERPVVIQRSRILRYRPKWEKWNLEFTICVMTDEISKEVLKSALEYGGSYVGIGDFRPEKKGPFGRFMITEFKEAK